LSRARHPHAGGVFAQGQFLADLGEGKILEIAQEERLPVADAELVHRPVEHRPDPVPDVGRLGRRQLLEQLRRLLPGPTPSFRADRVARRVVRAGVEPARQGAVTAQGAGFAGERGKDVLDDILGQMHVAPDLPQRGRKNEFHVPVDQGGEGLFRAGPHVG
jgi:hypothetical protein